MAWAKNIIILSILLRLLIIPFLYHPDIKTQYYQAQFFSKGIINIYDYIQSNSKELGNNVPFVYTPPSYFILGLWYPIAKQIAPSDLSSWLNNWGTGQNDYDNLPWFIFILKLPYLCIDLFFGVYLLKKYGQKIAQYWLLNPFVLYSLYFHSNFDIIPSLLAFISLSMLDSKNYPKIAGVLFATAVAIKLFPLLFLPIILKQKVKNTLQFSLYFLVTSFLYIILFNTITPNWLESVTSSGLLQKTFELKILNLPIFPILYILITLLSFYYRNKNMYLYATVIGMLFLSTVTFHGQWLIWFLPYSIFIYNNHRPKLKLLFLLFLLTQIIKITIYNDTYMTWGHFLPLSTDFLGQVTPYSILYAKDTLLPQNLTRVLQLKQTFFVILFFMHNVKKNSNS